MNDRLPLPPKTQMDPKAGLFEDPWRLENNLANWRRRLTDYDHSPIVCPPLLAINILQELADYSFRQRTEWKCQVATSTLARRLGCGRTTVIKYLRALAYCGFLRIWQGSRGGGDDDEREANTYQLTPRNGSWIEGKEKDFDFNKVPRDVQWKALRDHNAIVTEYDRKNYAFGGGGSAVTATEETHEGGDLQDSAEFEGVNVSPRNTPNVSPRNIDGSGQCIATKQVYPTTQQPSNPNPPNNLGVSYVDNCITRARDVVLDVDHPSWPFTVGHQAPKPFPFKAAHFEAGKDADVVGSFMLFLLKTPTSNNWSKAFLTWLQREKHPKPDVIDYTQTRVCVLKTYFQGQDSYLETSDLLRMQAPIDTKDRSQWNRVWRDT